MSEPASKRAKTSAASSGALLRAALAPDICGAQWRVDWSHSLLPHPPPPSCVLVMHLSLVVVQGVDWCHSELPPTPPPGRCPTHVCGFMYNPRHGLNHVRRRRWVLGAGLARSAVVVAPWAAACTPAQQILTGPSACHLRDCAVNFSAEYASTCTIPTDFVGLPLVGKVRVLPGRSLCRAVRSGTKTGAGVASSAPCTLPPADRSVHAAGAGVRAA